MANEIATRYTSGQTLYAVLLSPTGQAYRTDSHIFEAPVNANWANYAITLTEQGTTGLYEGNMPASPAGWYGVVVCKRAGGSPAVTDATPANGPLPWDGAQVAVPAQLSAAGIDAVWKRDSGLALGQAASGRTPLQALQFVGNGFAVDGADPTIIHPLDDHGGILLDANGVQIAFKQVVAVGGQPVATIQRQ